MKKRNAICVARISDLLDGAPITATYNHARTYSGMASFELMFNIDQFEEDTTYIAEISCSCVNGTDRTCFTNTSRNLKYAVGTTQGIARTGVWLNSTNTVTDKNSYNIQDEYIYVCANVTNPNPERIPLEINYNYRCGNNDTSTDRVVIDSKREIRGISGNTTQNQCAQLR